jgi:pimeloyl-ACP methyl ester carboxylesterase
MLSSLGDMLVEKVGATPPKVIALHGWMRTGADFAPIVDGLDAVSIHLPGFGITAEPLTAWGSAEYADAVATVIEGFGPVVIVGHSFGGRVAVHLASKYPHLVSGLVLTGVPLVRLVAAPKPALSFRIARALNRAKIVPDSVMERQRRKHGSADYRNSNGVMRDVLVRTVRETYEPQLRGISAPTRMVWGENDTSAPADAGLAASKLMPDAAFRTVPAGHLLDEPLRSAVRAELHALLKEVSA